MSDSATLQKQFELLQHQQQQKLQRLKQRKDEKEKTQIKANSDKNSKRKTTEVLSSTAFGIDDDLDLKLADPPSGGSIYTEELVTHLNNQIRELKDETGRLYKLLSERDFEIRQYRKKQGTFEKSVSLKGNDVTNETAATKIVELSKKVRELTAECESEKTKAKQWAKKCMDLENQMRSTGENGSTLHTSRGDASENLNEGKNTENELKSLNDKIRSLESKVAEYRNSSASLKQELKIAHKVLANEIGEGVTIQHLLNQPSGWRGRAQQILTLQKKVQELKIQHEQQQLGTRMDDFNEEIMRGTSATGSTTYRHSTSDERHRSQIRKVEKDRKEAQERMANEFKALEADYEALKGKLDAAKARNKVLSTDIKAQKQQVATLLDKGKHDDELIQALMSQLSQLKKLMENTQTEIEKDEDRKSEEMKKASMKSQQEGNIVSQLQTIVAEKEAKVKDLELEVNNIRLANLQKVQMNNINAMFERASSRAESRFSMQQNSAMMDSLEISPGVPQSNTLIGPISQKEPVGNFHNNEEDRAGSRQSILLESDMNDRPMSRKGSSRAETRLSSSEMEELRRRNSELQSMFQVCEVEKNRLAQLVEVLEHRNKEVVHKELDIQKELQMLKRKNVHLEKQLGKEQVTKSAGTKKAASNKMRASMSNFNGTLEDDGVLSNMSQEELLTRLEIQQDETEALKAALQKTLKAKEEDLRLYNEIMEQTKQVFLQGLRQYRQGSAS